MTKLIHNAVYAVFGVALIISPLFTPVALASEFRFNNENWFTTPHPKVASFFVRTDGSAYGTTTTGIPFEQINIPNGSGFRIQEFIMQDHYHFVIDGKVAYSLAALSVLITQLSE
jgi:hypothetical protein